MLYAIVFAAGLLVGWNIPAPKAALDFWAWAKAKVSG